MRHSHLTLTYNKRILSAPLNCSEDFFDYLIEIWDKKLIGIQEQVYILYLNDSNQVIAWRCFNTGSGYQSSFDLKMILACALGCMASKIIIAHNHPSCILRPSKADLLITDRVNRAAQLVDIKLEDHIIMCRMHYYSFVDNGVMKN